MTKRVHCLSPGPRRLHHRRRQETRSRTESAFTRPPLMTRQREAELAGGHWHFSL